ncbi:biotin--[acetyl-CoA-carboxylase] ligase [Dolosigranulum pigrum]|uniref:biotin--[acetyl-CoA-carboxylase] ligase n=1 Tax=Dolosigranulum pigrum TaxID=29394 RepID=UPI000DC4D14D|nr:biotin--[acetyl-CoA-carboxylase] ligase [Dolosigranulum pigrum]QJS96654.1 biotin--[acetyl-CoA-carboxylase] ligase [Dolosigranulum pigrum]
MHSHLIFQLNKQFPNPVPIETLSQQLNCSAAEITEAVEELRALGLVIHSYNSGLQLASPLYSIPGIKTYLNTQTFGNQGLYLFETIDSTHTYVSNNLSTIDHGSVLLAYSQTAGRGRRGRKWSSPIGKSLSLSIVLKEFSAQMKPTLLTQLTAAALQQALSETGLPIAIKWPNDLLINRRKVAGVLTEAMFERQVLQAITIGIGINLNQSQTDFPTEIHTKATSLALETESPFFADKLIAQFLQYFEQFYQDYQQSLDPKPFLSICRQESAVIGESVTVVQGDKRRDVEVLGIEATGELLVRDLSSQEQMTLISSEVSLRNPDGSYI